MFFTENGDEWVPREGVNLNSQSYESSDPLSNNGYKTIEIPNERVKHNHQEGGYVYHTTFWIKKTISIHLNRSI